MARETFGGSSGAVAHPAGWDEQQVGGGRRGSEAERYQGIGAAAAKRQAYQADFGKAMGDESRGLQARGQQDAGLRYMRQAAMGNAPSQAAILGDQAAGQSLGAQMQAGAGGRGLGAAAAQMQAAQVQPGQQLGAVQQYSGMRGNEMAHAQAAFGAGANQMRAGDYSQQGMAQQRAEAQARAEQTQRELNQAAQMGYERMGVRGNQAQSDGELRQGAIHAKENQTKDEAKDAEDGRFVNWAKGATKTVASWFGLSDERTKRDVKPIGGLASVYEHLREMKRDQEQGGADERDVSAIRGMDPDSKQRRDLHRAMEESTVGAHPYANEREPAGTLTGGPGGAPDGYYASRAGQVGDVTGRGPEASYDLGFGAGPSGQAQGTGLAPGSDDFAKYGESVDRKTMLSDDKTKLAKAWEEGRQATISDVQTLRQKSPDELKALGAKGNSLANAVRGAKADAYDQALGKSQHIMTVPPDMPKPPEVEVQPSGMWHQQPPAPVRKAAVDHVGPGMAPDYQQMAGQTLAMSDERTKKNAHEEGEMGRQLAKGFKPFEYEYKPGFAEHEGQQRGEKNVGPMAQDMAANPITATAVSKRPDGLLQIDIPKVTKINSAGIGYLAAELQKLKERR